MIHSRTDFDYGFSAETTHNLQIAVAGNLLAALFDPAVRPRRKMHRGRHIGIDSALRHRTLPYEILERGFSLTQWRAEGGCLLGSRGNRCATDPSSGHGGTNDKLATSRIGHYHPFFVGDRNSAQASVPGDGAAPSAGKALVSPKPQQRLNCRRGIRSNADIMAALI